MSPVPLERLKAALANIRGDTGSETARNQSSALFKCPECDTVYISSDVQFCPECDVAVTRVPDEQELGFDQ